jgi:hypothetical protein
VEAADSSGRLRAPSGAVEAAWRALAGLLPLQGPEGPEPGAGGPRCGLCRGGTGPGPAVEEAGAVYHPPCANYWVNRVGSVLPRLA